MKVGVRGQVTIPKKYRRHFGLAPATEVEFVVQNGELVLKKSGPKTHPIGKFVGILQGRGLRSDALVKAMRG